MAKIVFFDGHCALCNAMTDKLLRLLQKNLQCKIQMAPLQGETAQKQLSLSLRQELNTLVYVRDGHIHTRSTAILFLLSDVGGGWRFARVFFILPLWFRDSLYNLLAKNRHRWGTRHDTCRLPKASEKDRLLP